MNSLAFERPKPEHFQVEPRLRLEQEMGFHVQVVWRVRRDGAALQGNLTLAGISDEGETLGDTGSGQTSLLNGGAELRNWQGGDASVARTADGKEALQATSYAFVNESIDAMYVSVYVSFTPSTAVNHMELSLIHI